LSRIDFRFCLIDERVEFGNLFRILSLLMFAEPEEIGGIGRAPAVEEQFVLVNDRGSECGALLLPDRFPLWLSFRFGRNAGQESRRPRPSKVPYSPPR